LSHGCGHAFYHAPSNQGQSGVFPLLDFVHVPLPLPHHSRFREALCFWESRPPFVDISTIFRKGDSILILILLSMRDLGRHRGKHHCSLMSLTPITFDANTFSCCGGSYFATIAVFLIRCRRPLNLVGPPMPTSPSLFTSATITTGSEYVPLQNCLLPLSFRPRGRCSCLHQHFRHFFFRVTSHEHGACPPRLYTLVYLIHTLWKVGIYRFLSSPTDCSTRSHSCSPLQHHSQ
jgi:hypothetical protein